MEKNKLKVSEKSCSLRDVLDIIGGKWSMPIIYILSKGKMRFMEIERSVEGINTRMLVKELKNMEANGIVTREVFPTVPPTVEYALTEKGAKLLPSIVSLHQWGEEFANGLKWCVIWKAKSNALFLNDSYIWISFDDQKTTQIAIASRCDMDDESECGEITERRRYTEG